MLHILGWILAGLVIGFIAKVIHPGPDPKGFLPTMAIGIGGALLGGFIGRAIGFYGPNEGAGWIISIVGAIILLAIYTAVTRRDRPLPGPRGPL